MALEPASLTAAHLRATRVGGGGWQTWHPRHACENPKGFWLHTVQPDCFRIYTHQPVNTHARIYRLTLHPCNVIIQRLKLDLTSFTFVKGAPTRMSFFMRVIFSGCAMLSRWVPEAHLFIFRQGFVFFFFSCSCHLMIYCLRPSFQQVNLGFQAHDWN